MQNALIQMLTIGAASIMAVFAFLAFRETSENYAAMPERIPMHFGLSGKADSWAAKSKFTAYLMPGFTLFPLAMLIVIYLIMYFSNEMELEAMLAMSLILTPVAWLMYSVNRAIIDYSLKKAGSVWPYMKWPMIVMGVMIAASLYIPFSMMKKPAEITGVAFYDSVDSRMRPGRPITEFKGDEKYLYALVSWKYLNGKPEVRYDWYTPDGELIHKGIDKRKFNKVHEKRKTCDILNLDDYRKRGVSISGKWKLDIFVNGNKKKTAEFIIP